MNKRETERLRRLLPNGKPKYVRCYDNGGKSLDRYTVVFSGRYTRKTGGEHWFLCMNDAPFHPQGIGMHGADRNIIDWPTYGHLGRKIPFSALPEDCQLAAMRDYIYLWDLPHKRDDSPTTAEVKRLRSAA